MVANTAGKSELRFHSNVYLFLLTGYIRNHANFNNESEAN